MKSQLGRVALLQLGHDVHACAHILAARAHSCAHILADTYLRTHTCAHILAHTYLRTHNDLRTHAREENWFVTASEDARLLGEENYKITQGRGSRGGIQSS